MGFELQEEILNGMEKPFENDPLKYLWESMMHTSYALGMHVIFFFFNAQLFFSTCSGKQL